MDSVMKKTKLTSEDWDEIYYALETKAIAIGNGLYDSEPGEIDSPRSETLEWGNHIRRIMAKIGEPSLLSRGTPGLFWV
jgi:hypothetical protein